METLVALDLWQHTASTRNNLLICLIFSFHIRYI